MKLEIKSFRTKVAQRIFIMFMICAILPISTLALISFAHVEKQLNEQSKRRLRQETKSMAVSIYERLLFLRSEMGTLATNVEDHLEHPLGMGAVPFPKRIEERFSALALISDKGLLKLSGHLKNPPTLRSEEMDHLLSGNALLVCEKGSDFPPDLFMGLALNGNESIRGILMGQINRSYLWEAAEGRPLHSELCVLDQLNNLLFSSSDEFALFSGSQTKRFTAHSGQFEIRLDETDYLAAYSTLFLQPNFFMPEWIVVLFESKQDVLAPMDDFKLTFPVLLILSLGMVFFLSMALIRKQMGPIEILKGAAQKIARGAFGHKINIKSGDEFESLGHDFNEMSDKLKEGQELLVHAAKISTIGQMTASILHEIRQPLNAIHALENEQEKDRTLIIRTLSSDHQVFLEIEDNGCGIPEHIQEHIFDPFFTTKSPDQGTGPGMAIIEAILQKHHADIAFESDPGMGTTFKIAFPFFGPKEAS